MSLQIYLPLNGDIKNYGLLNKETQANATIPFEDGIVYSKMAALQTKYIDIIGAYHDITTWDDWSVAVWIYPLQADSHSNTIINSGNWNDITTLWHIALRGYNASTQRFTRLILPTTNSWEGAPIDGLNIPLNAWTHLCITYNYTTKKDLIYVNGVKVAEYSATDSTTHNKNTTSYPNLRLGANNYSTGMWIHSKLQDFRMYNHTLSQSEINKLYTDIHLTHGLQFWLPLNGNYRQQGLMNCKCTDATGVTWPTTGKFGACMAAGNATQTPNGLFYNNNLVDMLNDNNHQRTISVWVRPLGNHVHYDGTIISSGDWNHDHWSFGLKQDNSAVSLFNHGHSNYMTCAVPVNIWTHLVCINDNSQIYLYKNGEYIGNQSGSANWVSDSNQVAIGRETYAGGYFSFNGNIADLKIYDRVLTQNEIKFLSKGRTVHYSLNGFPSKKINPNLAKAASNYYIERHGQTVNASSWGGDAGTITYYHYGGYNNYPYKLYHKTANGSGGIYDRPGLSNPDHEFYLKANETYTVSAWIKSSTNCSDSAHSFGINRRDGNLYYNAGHSQNYSTSWQFYSFTFTVGTDSGGYYDDQSIFYVNSAPIDLYISGFKVEEGSTPTAWVPYMPELIKSDSNGFIHNITANNNLFTLVKNSPRYSQSILLNEPNSGDITHLRSLTSTATEQEWTCCAWVYLNEDIFAQLNEFNKGNNIIHNNTYKSLLYLNDNGQAHNDYYVYSNIGITLNAWVHVSFVFQNSTGLRKIYYNGIDVSGTGPNSTSLPWGINDTINLFTSLKGNIVDYQEYATALSADDIMELYQMGHVPTT